MMPTIELMQGDCLECMKEIPGGKMNPANGWGNADGALATLSRLHQWCRAHPEGVLRIYA